MTIPLPTPHDPLTVADDAEITVTTRETPGQMTIDGRCVATRVTVVTITETIENGVPF